MTAPLGLLPTTVEPDGLESALGPAEPALWSLTLSPVDCWMGAPRHSLAAPAGQGAGAPVAAAVAEPKVESPLKAAAPRAWVDDRFVVVAPAAERLEVGAGAVRPAAAELKRGAGCHQGYRSVVANLAGGS